MSRNTPTTRFGSMLLKRGFDAHPTFPSRSIYPIHFSTHSQTTYSPPQADGFGSWLNSFSNFEPRDTRFTSLANLSTRSIRSMDNDIPSPTTLADDRNSRLPASYQEASPVVESTCEVVHPRPKTFWVLTQQRLAGMEAQAADMVEQNEKEMHAQAVAAGLVFERSDDDEIVVLPKRRQDRASISSFDAISPPRHARN